ncbi:hypothetical protein KKH05_00175 [Patescibacteria group bacterium]|nr:hypothetical protein [Patescibacteria group bacterium]
MKIYEKFSVGDWVTWAYEPKSLDGPYAYMVSHSHFNGDRDPIADRLLRYEPPPYLVVQVVPQKFMWQGSVKNGSKQANVSYHEYLKGTGHPQSVRVEMHLKEGWGGPLLKLRRFSGVLFTKTTLPEGR